MELFSIFKRLIINYNKSNRHPELSDSFGDRLQNSTNKESIDNIFNDFKITNESDFKDLLVNIGDISQELKQNYQTSNFSTEEKTYLVNDFSAKIDNINPPILNAPCNIACLDRYKRDVSKALLIGLISECWPCAAVSVIYAGWERRICDRKC